MSREIEEDPYITQIMSREIDAGLFVDASEEEYDPYDYYDERDDMPYLAGCTCDHEQDDHDYDHCLIKDCDCTGHWEV